MVGVDARPGKEFRTRSPYHWPLLTAGHEAVPDAAIESRQRQPDLRATFYLG